MKVLKSQEELKTYLNEAGSKLVVVDFFAEWCGPCKMIAPKLVKMDEEEFQDVFFGKVDVDENEESGATYQIRAMPTFKLFKNGEVVDELVGANVDKLRDLINKHK